MNCDVSKRCSLCDPCVGCGGCGKIGDPSDCRRKEGKVIPSTLHFGALRVTAFSVHAPFRGIFLTLTFYTIMAIYHI